MPSKSLAVFCVGAAGRGPLVPRRLEERLQLGRRPIPRIEIIVVVRIQLHLLGRLLDAARGEEILDLRGVHLREIIARGLT